MSLNDVPCYLFINLWSTIIKIPKKANFDWLIFGLKEMRYELNLTKTFELDDLFEGLGWNSWFGS